MQGRVFTTWVPIRLVTLLHAGPIVACLLVNQVWLALYVSSSTTWESSSRIVPLDVSVLIIIPFILSLMPAMRCIVEITEPRCRLHRIRSDDYLVIWRIISFYGVAVCSHHLSRQRLFSSSSLYTRRRHVLSDSFISLLLHDPLE